MNRRRRLSLPEPPSETIDRLMLAHADSVARQVRTIVARHLQRYRFVLLGLEEKGWTLSGVGCHDCKTGLLIGRRVVPTDPRIAYQLYCIDCGATTEMLEKDGEFDRYRRRVLKHLPE